MKQRIKQIIIGMCVLLSIVGIVHWFTEKERVSVNFAENLFEYPLPPETEVIDKDYFYGYSFNHLTGSGGSMPVVASMKLSTTLSRETILHFYKDTEFFPFPKSETKGVKLELYFEDEYNLQMTKDGYYYNNKTGHTDYVNKVVSIKSVNKEEQNELQYVLQISSSFHYFLQLD